MCSVVDGADFPARTPKLPFIPGERPCQKCKDTGSVVQLRGKDVYCEQCFISAMRHKFRSTLGKNKVMRAGDRVLIDFDGSASSVALLHLAKTRDEYDCDKKQRRVLYTSEVVAIDDSAAFGINIAEGSKRSMETTALARRLGFEVIEARLEFALLEDNCPVPTGDRINDEFRAKTKALFDSAADQSAKESLLKQLKRRLLIRIASDKGFNKIFTSESSTSLAITLLSGIAIGRGMQIPRDVSFRDGVRMQNSESEEGAAGVDLIRPLREFSSEEVETYNTFHPYGSGLEKWFFATDALASIERLTESFVCGLQRDFPSTIPTLFRTGDKLQVAACDNSADDGDDDNECLLCGGTIDTSTADSCALQATKFSKLVSEKGSTHLTEELLRDTERLRLSTEKITSHQELSVPGSDGAKGCCGEDSGSCGDRDRSSSGCCSDASRVPDRISIEKYLCYSCCLVSGKTEMLPDFVVSKAARRDRRSAARKEIDEFIL